MDLPLAGCWCQVLGLPSLQSHEPNDLPWFVNFPACGILLQPQTLAPLGDPLLAGRQL